MRQKITTLWEQIEWAKNKLRKATNGGDVKVEYTNVENGMNINISCEFDLYKPIPKQELKKRFKEDII